MQVRGKNEVKHERAQEVSQGAVPFKVWARYNTGLHRTNQRDDTVKGTVYIVQSGLRRGVLIGEQKGEEANQE